MQAKYEDGKIARVGDVGRFIDAEGTEGQFWQGIVTSIDPQERLIVEDIYDGSTVTVKADRVRLIPA